MAVWIAVQKLVISWLRNAFVIQTNAILPLFCLLLAFHTEVKAQQEPPEAPYDRVYKVGLPNVPGLMFRNPDGTPGGFPLEILEHMAQDEKIKIEWVDGSWPDLFQKLRNGEIDVLPGTQDTPERTEYLDFLNTPLYTMWSEVYIRSSDKANFEISSLSKKRIGLVENDNNAIGFNKYISHFALNYKIVPYPDHNSMFEALGKGEIFAAVGPRMIFTDTLKKYQLSSSGMYFNPTGLSIAFPKGKNIKLRQALDNRLAIYKADGDSIFNQLYIKHGLALVKEDNTQFIVYLKYSIFTLIGIGVTVSIFAITLNVQVKARTAELKKAEKELRIAHSELQHYSQELEKQVERRTEQLAQKNSQLEASMSELKTAQAQLVLAEKMAVLGNLIAGIAHGINTPLGAINSSAEMISANMTRVINDLETINGWLHGPDGPQVKKLFNQIISCNNNSISHSTRQERELKMALTDQLKDSNIEQASDKAQLLVSMNLHENWQEYQELLSHNNGIEILQETASLSDIFQGCNLIEIAVARASSIIKSLGHYLHSSGSNGGNQNFGPVNVSEGIETVLMLFQGRLRCGIELQKNYDDVPMVLAIADELNQVWTNLILNALQAMDNSGTLTISIKQNEGQICVKIQDSGYGIPESIVSRVFEPFFTTKEPGQANGLGLDIARRIVERHKGSISLTSQCGQGTVVTVCLPVFNWH